MMFFISVHMSKLMQMPGKLISLLKFILSFKMFQLANYAKHSFKFFPPHMTTMQISSYHNLIACTLLTLVSSIVQKPKGCTEHPIHSNTARALYYRVVVVSSRILLIYFAGTGTGDNAVSTFYMLS